MSDSFDPADTRTPPYWIAALLVLWLSLVVVGAGFAVAVLLSSAEDYTESTSFQLVLCMTGGALGASLTALLAAGERIARGWSFGLDALARTERSFNARLAPLLAVQPILGAALGMVLLLALSSGSVMLLRLTEGTTFDPMGLLLFSVIAGLFARTLLARVRDSVEALFGRATGGAEPDPLRVVRSPLPGRDAPAVPAPVAVPPQAGEPATPSVPASATPASTEPKSTVQVP
jgi:hypothetical protein